MMRTLGVLVTVVLLAAEVHAQSQDLNAYLNSKALRDQAADVARMDPGSRDDAAIRNLLPLRVSQSFVNFMQTKQSRGLLDVVEALRLNKMLTTPPGTGGTSLISKVAAPAVLGAAIEYGGILQQTAGQVTTLRANALGVGRLLFGSEQFPYCPEIDVSGCGMTSRILRSLSGTVALENKRPATPGTAPVVPTPGDLLGDDFRTASWGVHIDVTPSNNLDDPKYVTAWASAVGRLQKDPVAAQLSSAVVTFFKTAVSSEVYTTWASETVALLMKAPTETEFYASLENQLTFLVSRLGETDPQVSTNLVRLRRAYSNYFDVRDAFIREAHVHKMSLEFTNLRPLDKPSTWNARFVYSHQPTSAPTLVTANASATWYSEQGPNDERWRDLQLSGQLDRRLSEIPRFGYAIATFGVYYQWMKEDALIQIPEGTTAPGTSIVLPVVASKVLNTKGHIVVAQGQLSVPVGEIVKVPFSVTWANRTELIKEKDVRGQVGMTIDLDGLFH